MLRKLSIFVGPFTLEAAQAVASEAELDETQVANAVNRLIAKSLVSVINTPAKARQAIGCWRRRVFMR